MSNHVVNGKTPRSDTELVRQLVQRIRALETRSALRVGSWVINTVDDKLVATNQTGEVLDIGSPPAAEEDTGPDRGAEFDIPGAVSTEIQNQIDAGNVLSPTSQLPASNLVGAAPPTLVDVAPLGSLNDAPQELLANPVFSAGSMLNIDDPAWSHDPDVWYGNLEDAGSAKVVADGEQHELVSNPSRIVVGQNVPATIHVRWEDLTSTSTPIQLRVVGYRPKLLNPRKLEVLESVAVDVVSAPTVNSIDHPDADDDGWVTLTAEYDPGALVTHAAMGLFLGDTASAGSIWWSAGSLSRAPVPVPQAAVVGLPATTAAATAANTNLIDSIINMVNEWFGVGTSPVGTPEEVAETFEAIRTAVAGGFTLQTFTSSNATWSVPPELAAASEAYVAVVGGGGKGTRGLPLTSGTGGTNSADSGGIGGTDGGYVNETIDPSTLGATLAIVVGAAATTNGTNGGVSSVTNGATVLASSVTGAGGIASVQGYLASTSTPGAGGKGGGNVDTTAAANNGSPGTSNPAAAGGAGGSGVRDLAANVTGGTGGAGVNGKYTTLPIAGGGGGGGGGGANTASFGVATGGLGGTGGFPGGGSGGGGGANGFTEVGGAAGTPANGIVAIYWR